MASATRGARNFELVRLEEKLKQIRANAGIPQPDSPDVVNGKKRYIKDVAPQTGSNAIPAPGPDPTIKDGAIFLSYASEDAARVWRLRDALEAAGLPVWFDQRRLEAGEDFKEIIKENVQRCSYFVPCLSANTLNVQRRFFIFDWNIALEESLFRPQTDTFIIPVILDDTPRDHPGIPPAFRKLHMQVCSEGVPPPAFAKLTYSRWVAHAASQRQSGR